MARILSQTLIRESQWLIRDSSSSSHLLSGDLGGAARSLLLPPSSRLVNHRGRSGRPEKPPDLLELDLEPAATDESTTTAGDVAGGGGEWTPHGGMRRRLLEEAIHGIVIRRSAPDWLPFIPGASYWVPPPPLKKKKKNPYHGVGELVGRVFADHPMAMMMMTEEESMSFTTNRGWPCVEFLVEGRSPHPIVKRTKVADVQYDDGEE